MVTAELPEPLTDWGENDALAPPGKPLAVRATLDEKPPMEVSETE
jgi:hypothetical protein